MKTNAVPNRRKKYIINPKFQYRFILATLIPNFASLIIFYLMIDLYFMKLSQDGKELGLAENHPYFLLLRDQSMLMNKVFIIVAILTTLFFLVWGIIFSHKIAGPLYRLRAHFDDSAGTKEIKRLSFRPGDFFQEIPEAYNRWLESLHKK